MVFCLDRAGAGAGADGEGIAAKTSPGWRGRATRGYIGRVLSILLVRFSSIGDVLLTTPLLRALRRRHPGARLVFVTKRAMAPLVADNPHLSDVVTLEPSEPVRHFAARLAAPRPTHGLDLHGSLPRPSPRLP